MDMQQSTAPMTPEIQPEELEALRIVVALITRVCFMVGRLIAIICFNVHDRTL